MGLFYSFYAAYKDSNAQKEQLKMTREEAIEIVRNIGNSKSWYEAEVDQLEALGLLKFDKEKKDVTLLYQTYLVLNTYTQYVRLELWSEGLVLWVGDEIKWKSWEKILEKTFVIGDTVSVSTQELLKGLVRPL